MNRPKFLILLLIISVSLNLVMIYGLLSNFIKSKQILKSLDKTPSSEYLEKIVNFYDKKDYSNTIAYSKRYLNKIAMMNEPPVASVFLYEGYSYYFLLQKETSTNRSIMLASGMSSVSNFLNYETSSYAPYYLNGLFLLCYENDLEKTSSAIESFQKSKRFANNSQSNLINYNLAIAFISRSLLYRDNKRFKNNDHFNEDISNAINLLSPLSNENSTQALKYANEIKDFK